MWIAHKPILDTIAVKVKDRLDSPLHLAGYELNPYYNYKDDEVVRKSRVMKAIVTCVEKFFHNDCDTK